MPTISVAMCTHNGARWVGEQVRSILAQDLPPDELVVSDDASSDDTLAIVEREAAGAPVRLRVLRNETPLRVTANFQQALQAAEGDLIALCDQDDVWPADRLSRAAAVFAERPEVELVFGDARIVDGAGEPTGATLFGDLGLSDAERAEIEGGRAVEALLRRNLVTGATAMVRRELVARAAPFPPDWVHDEWLAMVAALTGDLAIAPSALIDYRIHGGNQIGVARLTPAAAWRRLTEPRGERNRRMAAAADQLEARLPALGDSVSAGDAALVRGKAGHERFRAGLPEARLRRIGPVLRRFRGGDYRRFSRGVQDVLRDLVQPAR